LESLTDTELIHIALNRDGQSSRAYAIVFERYRPKIGGYLRLQLNGDQALADDLTQEIYLKSWSKIDRLNNIDQYYSWLAVIARNAFMDYLRDKKRQSHLLEWLTLEPSEPLYAEPEQGLESLLYGLDQADKDIVLMRSVMELSFQEISEALNIRLSAAKMRYYRALEQLKDQH